MAKSFIFLTLVLSMILVHTCSAGPTQLSTRGVDSDDDDDESGDSSDGEDSGSDSESDDDKNEENPALTCILFGEQACQIECSVLAKAYTIDATGSCSTSQTCQCDVSNSISFEEAWKKKFNTGYTYNKIADDEHLLEQAHRIFNYPLRTGEQFKQLFKPVLSPHQYSKLEINDQSLAAKFIKDEDDVDTAAVQKYVSQEVAKQLKSAESLLKEKYQEKFKQVLEKTADSDGTLHNLIFRVRQLDNNSLKEVLKKYLENSKRKMADFKTIEKEGLNEILINTITNEIIKQTDEKSKPAAKKKASAKKPATADAKKPVSAGKRGARFQTTKKS